MHAGGGCKAIKHRDGQNYEIRDSEKMCVKIRDVVTMERETPKLLQSLIKTSRECLGCIRKLI